jgi:hypothetical protein
MRSAGAGASMPYGSIFVPIVGLPFVERIQWNIPQCPRRLRDYGAGVVMPVDTNAESQTTMDRL